MAFISRAEQSQVIELGSPIHGAIEGEDPHYFPGWASKGSPLFDEELPWPSLVQWNRWKCPHQSSNTVLVRDGHQGCPGVPEKAPGVDFADSMNRRPNDRRGSGPLIRAWSVPRYSKFYSMTPTTAPLFAGVTRYNIAVLATDSWPPKAGPLEARVVV